MHAVALAAELGIRQGGDPARGRRLLGLGDADERPPPRLLRHPPDDDDRGERAAARRAARRDDAARARRSSGARASARSRCGSSASGTSATRTRSTASRCRCPTARSTRLRSREIADSFHGAYEREYTYRLDAPVEFVGAHVVAIAEVGKLTPAPLPVTGRSLGDALKGRRQVDYATEGVHEADIYARRAARARDAASTGPADRRDERQHDDRRPSRERGHGRRLRQP